MYDLLWLLYVWYVRPVYKWFLRKTTGLCELQRLCYGEVSGAPRTLAVERSLSLTRSASLRQLFSHLQAVCDEGRFSGKHSREFVRGAVETVLLVKRVNPRVHGRFVRSLTGCVEHVFGYRQLVADVESLRQTPFDSNNDEHEAKLRVLWDCLMPDEPLYDRLTKQWQEIGFQGDDPKTDFRGMGMLGLDNLLYFVEEHGGVATRVLLHSRHPQFGYAFAIVGINLTSMAWQMLRDGDAKTYVYNACKGVPSMRIFHQFYSYLFYEFDRFWLECKPKDIMEFSNIRQRFEANVRQSLQDPSNVFRINVPVDTI